MLHELADRGGDMRLEVRECFTDERPSDAARGKVILALLSLPFGEIGVEEKR